MPIPSEVPWPLESDAPAWAADNDGDPALVEEPKPLHTSAVPARTDGEAVLAPAPALALGATELANTDLPPMLVTPAVAPRTRAANCDEAAEVPVAPAPLRSPLLLRLRFPPVAALVRPLERAAPDADTLVTEALPEDDDAGEPDADELLEADPAFEAAASVVTAPGVAAPPFPTPLLAAEDD